MNLKIVKIEFVSNIDWVKLWYIFGILTTWWGLATAVTFIFPYPIVDKVYKLVNVVLTASTGAALFAARGGKYVADRSQTPPADGKP